MADNDESNKEGEKKTVVIKESNEDAAAPGEQDEGKAAVAAVTAENTAGPSRKMSVTPRDGKVKGQAVLLHYVYVTNTMVDLNCVKIRGKTSTPKPC